jgi:transmembrane 9 superfamily member 2/4
MSTKFIRQNSPLFYALIFLTLISFISCHMIKELYTYKKNDRITLSVGSMNSVQTQIPFDYYYLQICKPDEIIKEPDNLGEILTGDISYKSNLQFQIGVDEYCKELCVKKFGPSDIHLFKWFLDRNYAASWYVDKLPAGMKHINFETMKSEVHYLGGIPLGKTEPTPNGEVNHVIYNHLTFTIQLHDEGQDMYTIVGFNITPFSLSQRSSDMRKCGDGSDKYSNYRSGIGKQLLIEDDILFTYDVIFEKSNVAFSSRWDHYLHLQNDNIHWFSLINSTLIISILSFILINIFCRALKRDIDIYNTKVTGEDFIDECGWKQVCNDVFRRPPARMFLASLIGSGIQLFAMVFYTLIFAIFGFLNPEKRGSLLMIMIFLFVFMGVIAGYFASRFYKMFGGKEWLKMSMLTAFLYPSILFLIFMIINFALLLENSSASVSADKVLKIKKLKFYFHLYF